jgi:cytochrome c
LWLRLAHPPNRYTDPDLVVKDDNMSFGVPKAEERRDLIAFLKR